MEIISLSILSISLIIHTYCKYIYHKCTFEIIKEIEVYDNDNSKRPIFRKITQQCKHCGELKTYKI